LQYLCGSAKQNAKESDVGGILHISKNHKISFEYGLSPGTNNAAEIKTACILMTIALEEGIIHKHLWRFQTSGGMDVRFKRKRSIRLPASSVSICTIYTGNTTGKPTDSPSRPEADSQVSF
jgi:hypothetical protein